MSRVETLFHFLQLLEYDTVEKVTRYSENIDLFVEKGIADQVINNILIENPTYYKQFVQAKRENERNKELLSDEQEALFYAAKYCNITLANFLLNNDLVSDVNIYDGVFSLLKTAIVLGSCTDMVELLLNKGALVEDGKPFSPLALAINIKQTDIVRLLIERGANVNRKYKDNIKEKTLSMLQLAKEEGNVEIIKLLEEQGAKE